MSSFDQAADRINAAVEKAEIGSEILSQVANGDEFTEVPTTSGPVPSLKKWQKDNMDLISGGVIARVDKAILSYPDYAAASAAAATLPDGQVIESPRSDGNVHKYVVAAGSLVDLGAAETYLSGSNIASDSSWSDVPEVVGAGELSAVNAQARALADRTEYSKNRALRRYIDVADYVSSDDSADARAAVQAALNDGVGREVVFTNPVGGSRAYRLLDRSAGGLFLLGNTRVIFEDGAYLDTSGWGRTGTRQSIMRAGGSVSSESDTVVSDIAIGTKTITLSSGSGSKYSRGDFVLITSDKVFGIYSYDTEGEIVEVASVSGDTITTVEAMSADYLVSDSTLIRKVNFVENISVEGAMIIGAGRRTDEQNADSGIYFNVARNVKAEGVNTKDVDFNSFVFNRCYGFSLADYSTLVEPTSATTGAQYGVAIIGAAMHGVIERGVSRLGRHAVAWTDQGVAGIGISRHVTIRDVTGIGQFGSSFTTHTSNEFGALLNCTSIGASAGCDIRVPNMAVDGLTARHFRSESNLQHGVILRGKASNLKVTNLRQYGGRFGVTSVAGSIDQLVRPDNIFIKNSEFYGQNQRAINLEHSAAEGIKGLRIEDNYVESSTTTCRIMAKFDAPIVSNNTFRWSSSVPSTNSPVLIQNCHNVCATDNKAIGYAGAVIIQTATGTTINRNNDVIST